MKGRLLNLLTWLSLALFVAAALLWARGYWVSDSISRARVRVDPIRCVSERTEVYTGRGVVMFCLLSDWRLLSDWYGTGTRPSATPPKWEWTRHAPRVPYFDGPNTRRGLGFFSAGHDGVAAGEGTRVRFIGFPLWLPTALFALLPLAHLSRRMRRRFPPGCCAGCGYELTGNTSGVCPECGRPVSGPARRPAGD